MNRIPQQWLGVGIVVLSLGGAGALAQENPVPVSEWGSGVPVVQVNGQETADQLFGEGVQLHQEGSPSSVQQAIEKWQRAVQLYRTVGNKKAEANTLGIIGIVYNHLGQPQEALNYLNQALPILQEVGEREGEALVLMSIGIVYSYIEQLQEALNYWNQALLIWQELGNRQQEAKTLDLIKLFEE